MEYIVSTNAMSVRESDNQKSNLLPLATIRVSVGDSFSFVADEKNKPFIVVDFPYAWEEKEAWIDRLWSAVLDACNRGFTVPVAMGNFYYSYDAKSDAVIRTSTLKRVWYSWNWFNSVIALDLISDPFPYFSFTLERNLDVVMGHALELKAAHPELKINNVELKDLRDQFTIDHPSYRAKLHEEWLEFVQEIESTKRAKKRWVSKAMVFELTDFLSCAMAVKFRDHELMIPDEEKMIVFALQWMIDNEINWKANYRKWVESQNVRKRGCLTMRTFEVQLSRIAEEAGLLSNLEKSNACPSIKLYWTTRWTN